MEYFVYGFSNYLIENENKRTRFGGINLSQGKSKGIDYHTSLGAKMYITPQAYFSMGGGLGASDKSIKIDSIEEEDILWSYQVFAGLNYFPTNHFQIGIDTGGLNQRL